MSDFAKKTETDLRKELLEKREALRNVRFGTAGSKSRNIREGRNIRREIARYLTELTKRSKNLA